MGKNSLQLLLEKMNEDSSSTIGKAVANCASSAHKELLWPHLLYQFIINDEPIITKILNISKIDIEGLKSSLLMELATVSKSSGNKPLFSREIVNLWEMAWIECSLTFQQKSITPAIIFLASLKNIDRSTSPYAKTLSNIKSTEIKEIIKATYSLHLVDANDSEMGEGANFLRNLTEEAKDEKLATIYGRDKEILQIIDILCRKRKNNPILVGEAGVGKTALVEGLAKRIINNDVPDELKGVELFELDLGLLKAGASVKGEFEKRLKSVVTDMQNGNRILFIDEVHMIMGAGGDNGTGDAANLLKPPLARGELRTVAATTWREYYKYIEKDPALSRRFQPVKVDEPDDKNAMLMLRAISSSFENRHGVLISDEAVRASVVLSRRYITDRQLPDKAVDLLDTACTRVKLGKSADPVELDLARRELLDINRTVERFKKEVELGIDIDSEYLEIINNRAAKLEIEVNDLDKRTKIERGKIFEIDKLREDKADIKDIQKATKEFNELVDKPHLLSISVSEKEIARVISTWTNIPVDDMNRDTFAEVAVLENRLNEKVIGQVGAIDEIKNIIASSKNMADEKEGPLAVMLFTGPSGVGKTESALTIGDVIFGGEKFTTTINMSEYREKHSVSRLVGAPPGYAGYGEGGLLTDAVRKKPYSLVILDEIDKAHKDILNLFYQLFDKGILVDGEGREVNFKNCIIVMTSNIGSEILNSELENSEQEEELLYDQLSEHFSVALLGRCRVVPFRPIGKDAITTIIDNRLNDSAASLEKGFNTKITINTIVTDYLVSKYSIGRGGVRDIFAIIEKNIVSKITAFLLSDIEKEESCITVDIVDNKVIISD